MKNWEKKIKKINFISLFGLEVKKIIFLDFTRCKLKKSEENKFLEIYLGIMEKKRYIFFFVIFQ